MIKHIVFWNLLEEAEGHSKQENAMKAKALLEGLLGKIPGLLHIEVGLDFSDTPDSADIVLYSEFESRTALNAYHHHPEHQAVAPFIGKIRCGRRVVDYEIA